VVRGLKPGVEFQLFDGRNFIGRADQQPVEVDIEDQEPPDRIWSSRQHALITCKGGSLVIEDLNSANGTYVNRNRVPPGQKLELKANDIVQIGTVQLQLRL
jgi:pSer/pThr/pTyr-binding forkhead associated (FHA) protein